MLARCTYDEARNRFQKLHGVDADDMSSRRTSVSELEGLLREFGVATRRQIFRRWDDFASHAIVKVDYSVLTNRYHWVVCEVGRAKKTVIHDPAKGSNAIVRDRRGWRGHGFAIVLQSPK